MTSSAPHPGRESSERKTGLTSLLVTGVASWLLYMAFSWVSRDFGYETPGPERPILLVLSLLVVAFACSLLALRAALRADGHHDLVTVIWVFAVAFRATVLLTEPFQEIDLYRYIWDGHATTAGVNPYRYSPSQVRSADRRQRLPRDLRRLAELRDTNPAVATILSRIHYEELTTVYPPVSQAVFAITAAATPRGATVKTHLVAMKLALTAFDLLTLFLLIRMLRHLGMPVGWAVAYGWCPLVVKEFANSGHLDSIAICLTTASLYFALTAFFPAASAGRGATGGTAEEHHSPIRGRPVMVAGLFLGLAIGAKLYPVVLAPLLFVTAWRRAGGRWAVCAASVASGVSACTLLPMFFGDASDCASDSVGWARPTAQRSLTETRWAQPTRRLRYAPPAPVTTHDGLLPPRPDVGLPRKTGGGPPTAASAVTPPATLAGRRRFRHPQTLPSNDGLAAFLSRWKMNDFLFYLVEANVSVSDGNGNEPAPWFVVTPLMWRTAATRGTQHIVERLTEQATGASQRLSDTQAAFLLARCATGMAFLILALWLACKAPKDARPARCLELAFLTLAWFWLLQPTQNPWYWIWALPLVPFARGRAWLAMSGLVLCYYARFWFTHHYADVTLLGTPYRGPAFFDNVIVWIEYAPWFLWLAADAFRRRVSGRNTQLKSRSV